MTEIEINPVLVVVEPLSGPIAVLEQQAVQVVNVPTGLEVVVSPATQVIALVASPPAVSVAVGDVAVVTVAQGVPGPKGDHGAAGSYFVWDQQLAAQVWSITHPLSKRPSVSVVDTADRLILGQVDYVDDSNLTVTFGRTVSGRAYLT